MIRFVPYPEHLKARSIAVLSGWARGKVRLKGIVLILLTIGIFCLLLRQIDPVRVWYSLRTIPLSIWIAAIVLTLAFPVMTAWRWQLILRTIGYRLSLTRCLLIIVGLWPISAISPSKSGDLLKALSLRGEVGAAIVMGSVIAERVLDLALLALFALIGGIVFQDLWIVGIAAGVILAMAAAVCIILLDIKLPGGEKVQLKVHELLMSLRSLGTSPGLLGGILLLTALNWFASIVQTKLLFDGVGAVVPLGFTVAALPVALFVGLLPITFAGMGTRDSAMLVMFAAYATQAQILAVGLLYTFFGYWLLALVGIPFVKKALHL